MRFLLFSVLFVFFLPVKSQEATDSSMLIDINKLLNFYDFEQMRSFIIHNGDKKTYCPNYKDNPHYEIADKKLEIYMNPSVDQPTKEGDYNIMYIVSKNGKMPFNYYLYMTGQRDVYLYDYKKYLSDEFIRDQVLAELNSILMDMKKEMKLLN